MQGPACLRSRTRTHKHVPRRAYDTAHRNGGEMTSFWTNREGFWNRGGWWKAVLVVAVYLVAYVAIGQLIGLTLGHTIAEGGPFASAWNVFLLLILPIALGTVVIVAFLAAIHWLGPIFARQPIAGRPWMWIAVAVVGYPIILRFIGIDYGGFQPGVVALTLLAGLFIGLAEELVTRGAAVTLLRKGGYKELVVAVLSAVLFASMHLINAIGSGFTITVALTVVYTFFYGICMYVVMRATGSIVWAIMLHALTDPTLFLSTGGIDTAAEGAQNIWLTIAGTGNWAVMIFGAVALFLIRGRVSPDTTIDEGAFAAKPA